MRRKMHFNRLHDSMGMHHLEPRNASNEVGDIVIGGVHHDVFGSSHLHHLAIAHDGNAVANADGFIKVVGDERLSSFSEFCSDG